VYSQTYSSQSLTPSLGLTGEPEDKGASTIPMVVSDSAGKEEKAFSAHRTNMQMKMELRRTVPILRRAQARLAPMIPRTTHQLLPFGKASSERRYGPRLVPRMKSLGVTIPSLLRMKIRLLLNWHYC
jgi:hypothetical protein